jgi:hypothetical protein
MFFTYNQNNSGGSFINNDKVCQYVVIEADDYRFANILAEDIGIYFNGCDTGQDCSCCGDRWNDAWNGDGTDEPLIYGKSPEDYNLWVKEGEIYCRVYYKNGTVEEFKK